VLLGIGAGWNVEEMQNHGADPTRRFAIMRERVEAMRRIWTEEEAEYRGQHVAFAPIRSWPKPKQRPHPPILVGGEGPRVLERVLAHGDAWAPNAEPGILERIAELQRRGIEQGRGAIPVTAMHVAPKLDEIRTYADAGATRVVFTLPSAPLSRIKDRIERLADLIATYRANAG
jgi:alkanesulfonate monooxygenase SsuD/methylene tetrahydromethanopterin reductase-like flavin-dependent oxidoreductase (luciferase family)